MTTEINSKLESNLQLVDMSVRADIGRQAQTVLKISHCAVSVEICQI